MGNKTCSEKRKSPSATLYTLLQDTAHQLLIMSKTYTTADVAQHKDESNGYWLIVENDVYDVSKFLEEHPGGAKILKRFAGKNATKSFWKYHNESVLKKYGAKLKIGGGRERQVVRGLLSGCGASRTASFLVHHVCT